MFRLAPGAGVLLACGLVLAGCDERAQAPAASSEPARVAAPPALPAADGPRITFEKTVHQFGSITDTKSHTATFRFTNTGTETLVISDVKAGCSCTVPTLRRRELLPGEQDTIDVTFNPRGRPGPMDESVTVVSNSKPEPTVKLTINALVEPMLRCGRLHRVGELRLGQEHKSVVRLSYDDPDLVIRDMRANSPHVTARLVEMGVVGPTVRGKATYEGAIEVTLAKTMPWGVLSGIRIQLKVYGRPEPQADPIDFDYNVFISGELYGELRATPKTLTFGRLGPNQPFEKAVTLSRSSGEPFTVTGARISETAIPGVEVRLEPVDGAPPRIVVSGSTGSHRRGFRGVITVSTDVPGEETLNIRFTGYVK
ncbi:MAG: DUF1573 domain-containing protein [Planctomycetota bacterium]